MKNLFRSILVCLLAVALIFALCGFDEPTTPEEMYDLGKQYADGDGVDKDYEKAME